MSLAGVRYWFSPVVHWFSGMVCMASVYRSKVRRYSSKRVMTSFSLFSVIIGLVLGDVIKTVLVLRFSPV